MSKDDSKLSDPNTAPRLWQVSGARWPMLVAIAVLAYFLFVGTLTGTEMVAGAAIILTAALVTRGAVGKTQAPKRDQIPSSETGPLSANLIDVLPDPCFLLDQRAEIVHQNKAAEIEFANASVGKPIAFSIRNPQLLAAIDAVRDGNMAQTIELHQTVPNATWFKVHVAPLELGDTESEGTVGWILVTMQSLTEQKRTEGMRVDFIANASHELRTPLTSLSGFIDTLQGPAAGDKKAQEKFLGIMRAQAQRMSNLIDDLLSLSRIELRQHVRPTSKANISLILTEVVEGLHTQAREADLNVNLSLPEANIEVTGDRDELYEVFENLIDNAIKYGAGSGDVTVTAEAVSNQGFDYKILVADNGPGISEEHVPRLTERFYRVDAESSRKKKGTGLGLAIVKHILNRHNGQMNIRSRLGEGTQVEVLLVK